jgi:hypothetical protein
MRRIRSAGFALIGLLALARCSSSAASGKGANEIAPGPNPTLGAGATGNGASANLGGAGQLAAETENETAFNTQVATNRFVWASNPSTNHVALVDAQAAAITEVLTAGFQPTYLAAVPNAAADRAVVLNVGSHDASLLEGPPSDPQASPAVPPHNVPVHPDANAWVVSANGRWAIAWTDSSQFKSPDATQGFQDVTVIDLGTWESPAATRLSIGYRPSRIFISQDEQRAFAVTDPGITVIDLSGTQPVVTEDMPVTENPLSEPPSHDVSVTPDGAWAVARHDGSPYVHVVDLATGKLQRVTLPGPVTDLDLVGGGQAAVAVVRQVDASSPPPGSGGSAGAAASAGVAGIGGAGGQTTSGARPSAVAILPLPDIYSQPTAYRLQLIPEVMVGSVATTSDKALLFTNAVPSPLLVILDTSPTGNLAYRILSVQTAITAVRPTPDGKHAIALVQASPSGSGSGFAVVPLDAELPPHIQATRAPVHRVAISDTAAAITVRDDANKAYDAWLVRMPELTADQIPLASPPLDVGIVPTAGRAFVPQAYPDGRVTLINLGDGSYQTVTGFELGVKANP